MPRSISNAGPYRGKGRAWWSALIVVGFVLVVALGFRYARSSGLTLGSRNGSFDSSMKLVLVVLATLQSSKIVRSGRRKGLWYASFGMLPVVLFTYSRDLPSHGPMALILAVVVTALWLASWLAIAWRRQRTALWCIGLCGGLAASVVVSRWTEFRAAAYGLYR
ncbi:MAG TPA: hypothetical protein VLJ38_03255 [Polyangiaceae bacterium]|nr:hypothetical protein [Polyangiaceae bacterium]